MFSYFLTSNPPYLSQLSICSSDLDSFFEYQGFLYFLCVLIVCSLLLWLLFVCGFCSCTSLSNIMFLLLYLFFFVLIAGAFLFEFYAVVVCSFPFFLCSLSFFLYSSPPAILFFHLMIVSPLSQRSLFALLEWRELYSRTL